MGCATGHVQVVGEPINFIKPSFALRIVRIKCFSAFDVIIRSIGRLFFFVRQHRLSDWRPGYLNTRTLCRRFQTVQRPLHAY